VIDVPAQPAVVAERRGALPVSERRLLLASLDLVAVAVAFVAAFNVRTSVARDAGFYIPRLGTVIVCGLWLVAAQIADAYDLRTAVSTRATARVLLTALSMCFGGLLLTFLIVPYRITRPTLVLWLPFAAITLFAGRYLYRRIFAGSFFAGRIALVTSSEALETVWPEVSRNLGGLYRVVGLVDPSRADSGQRLRTVVEQRKVDQIVLGVRDEVSRDLFRDVLGCHDKGVTVRSLADLYEELTGRLLLDQLGHTWLMSLPMRSNTSRLYASVKRGVDVITGAVGLVLFAVILLPIATLIKLEDRGPVFHRQKRVGKYGHTFTLIKLRTMRASTEAALVWAEKADPRITLIGRVLRKLHIDELPQAWNVLVGDMSLVGPRPEQPHYVEELRQQIDFYNTRLTVRPGLTGWAQVNHGYGSGVDGARVKLSYDLYYVKHQSVSLDLLILARTFLAVLSLKGT
jgi:exopolysaccharide biosynthesis polyprenyl glycosylphosphotransferase